MADFKTAQAYLLQNEGGYALMDGGTYCGIARNSWPTWVGWKLVDAQTLVPGEIIESEELASLVNTFYKHNFWNAIHGDEIILQPIATYCYDWIVNAGRNAVKEIQRLVGVTDDGIFGIGTLEALNKAGNILFLLSTYRLEYYRKIAVGDKEKYLKGWQNRAQGLYEKLA